MAEEELPRQWWKTPLELILEVLVASVVFLVIALVALGLSFIVHYFEGMGVDPIIIWGIKGIEYLVFIVDIILFVAFLCKAGFRTWKKL